MSKLELPTPRCTYADHSYPAYSKQQMLDFAEASRRAALEEAIQIIETHQVPIGNSAAGEMAAGWTMDALHEIRDSIRALATETNNG